MNKEKAVLIVAMIMLIYSILCIFIYQKEIGIVFNPFSLILSLFLCVPVGDGVIYLIAGSFILRRKNWARILAVVYSSVAFLLRLPLVLEGVVKPVVLSPGNFFVLHPKVMGITYYTADSFFSRSVAVGIVYLPLVLYCLFIFFLTRPEIKAQFSTKGGSVLSGKKEQLF